ncbi:MAG TPA: hypothetical protein VKU19_34080 [Bryobacteraceae bacterium]|nr:hypothetical protein [Bryobacteraceae bacterium]
MRNRLKFLFLFGILGLAVSTRCAHAQPLVRQGSFEIGPFVGTTYGIGNFRLMGGGNVTYAVNKYILPYFEYSYFPGIGKTSFGLTLPDGTPLNLVLHTIPLSDFHGGVHIRLPIHEKPVVPYLSVAFGGLYNPTTTVTANYMVFGQNVSQSLIVPGNVNPAFNAGGGIRYYLNQRFGLRVEAKGYKPFNRFIGPGTEVNAFGKVEAGFFYQLR